MRNPTADHQIPQEPGYRYLLWGFFGLLTTFVIEGPLRFLLATSGLPNAIYIRDAVAVISILIVFFRTLITKGWIDSPIAIVTFILLFHLILGLFFDTVLFQVLFGFKILVPLVFGIAISPILVRNFSFFSALMVFFFLISVTGVYINYLIDKMPWEGLDYETAFGNVTATQEWWIPGGIRRLPGLARTSYDAALIIGVSGLGCMLICKNFFLRLVVAANTIGAIYLTTSKGMVQAVLIISLWMLFRRSTNFLPLGRLLVVIFFVLTVSLPSVVVFFDIGRGATEHDIPPLLSSLWERFTWMWPDAFELMSKPEHYIFGKGLGSIGAPQEYGNHIEEFNSADNIFVYAFVLFGPLSLLYLSYPTWRVLRSHDCSDFACWSIGILIICFVYGLTTNMFEAPFFTALFGLVIGWALNANETSKNFKSTR